MRNEERGMRKEERGERNVNLNLNHYEEEDYRGSSEDASSCTHGLPDGDYYDQLCRIRTV